MDWQQHTEREFFRWLWTLADEPEGRARIETALTRVDATAFTGPRSRLYAAVTSVVDSGGYPVLQTVYEALAGAQALQTAGGDPELVECFGHVPQGWWGIGGTAEEPLTYSLESVCRWLRARADERRQREILARAQVASAEGRQSQLAEILDELYEPEAEQDTSASFADLLRSRITALAAPDLDRGTVDRSGLFAIDQAVGSWSAGDLVIVGGPTNSGKSTLMLELIAAWAERRVRVGYVSLEDGFKTLEERVTSRYSGIPLAEISAASTATREERGRLLAELNRRIQATDALHAPRVEVRRDAPVSEVRRVMQRLVRRYGCQVLIVDYVHAMKLDKKQERRHALAEAARILKAHAGRLGVPLILGAQCARVPKGEVPHKGHLRDSGELEEKAESILLTWHRADDDRRVIVAKRKQGSGKAWHIGARFDGGTVRYERLSDEETAAAERPNPNEFSDEPKTQRRRAYPGRSA